ncbi:hypothetical protein, variant 1 [Aphanomyces invadans]|uniref:RanBP2-type domain-containing protein n=1 Tax=Aphanomyces invadans TaxID=157072 RepID=A0A024UDD8_9STRA|nr:hypothetical protein, variant 1 [Aphanomyces invadans]ETW04289.1 hypothetical protein, variant 1 [Aphanomyces invadans]|eukprot:XP_008867245.1 hypothetical protein, variant 1 [Aphanomyces invadans]
MGRGPSPVLKGVKCIVDVRMSAGDADVDCSAAVSEKLESLGAKVMKRLGRDTTHVVWLNGNRNVREDTLKRNEVKLVGPLWVEACLQTATRVPETKFFPVETTANKSTPLPTPAAEKKKRRRSSLMEPRREDVFDELTTPIKKSRRKTLEQVTPLAITLTPQEGVQARSLSLCRQSRSPDCDEISQSTTPANLPTVHEAFDLPSQSDIRVTRQSIESNNPTPLSKAAPASKRETKRLSTPASTARATPKSTAKVVNQKDWPCPSCTFDNHRLAKRCKLCGTPSTGGKPSHVTELTDDLVATKPSTRHCNKQAGVPTTPSPLPSSKQRQSTPIIGTPKQRPLAQRRISTAKSPSIPRVKPGTPDKTTKVGKSPPEATKAKKIGDKVKSLESIRAVKAKMSYTSTAVEEKAMKTPPKKSATSNRATTAMSTATTATPVNGVSGFRPASVGSKTKRISRHVISVSGATLDTRLLLESSMREIDSSSGGGKSRIVDDFAAPVTHVVVSDTSKRTMKILFGLAQGAHIVSDAWVYSSLEAKKWLDETPFLMAQYPVPKTRPPRLFQGIKVYVASGVDPPKATLQALIVAAGGQACTQMTVASVCIGVEPAVGRRAKQAGIPMVSPKWLFDSLARGELGAVAPDGSGQS